MTTRVEPKQIRDLISGVLVREGVVEQDAGYVAEGLVQASVRGVDSHGIRLLPHYLKALAAGRINPVPNYHFSQTSPSTGVLDADHAFGHAAGMRAVHHATEMAQHAGMGAVAVKHSTHFGAAAFFALEIARKDMIGFSFTHSDSLIVPTHSSRRFLGNNPICFTAPCQGEEPICLDMATSLITFNKVLQLREEHKPAPPGVGVDQHGHETTDPGHIVNLLPVGGYKGYGLSLMVEILCALLTGMPFGPHIPRMYDAPIDHKRHLGQFFIALRIDVFTDINSFKKRMADLAESLRNEPPVDKNIAVMVAGDPEKQNAAHREADGIPMRTADLEFFNNLAAQYGLKWHTVSG